MDSTENEKLQTPPPEAPKKAAEPKEPIDKGLLLRLIIGATILVLFAVFALQNTESVEIEFLSWSFRISQFLMMLLSAIAGVLIWEFAGAYSRRAKKKRSKK